jgi:Tol biopolymer transport system component
MKHIFSLILTLVTSISFGQSPNAFDYCYENKKGICVYSILEKREVTIPVVGSYPCISPNGTEVTFTEDKNEGGRNICVYNLVTKRKKTLNINSQNCYGSVWSPDERFIAYNVIYPGINENWGIAVIDTGNHKPVDIIKPTNYNHIGYYSPTWSSDSKKIIFHNMDSIFIFDLNGTLQKKYRIKEFIASSSAKCILTPDEKKIVFETSVEEPDLWGLNESPSAIFIYDIINKTSKRITPVNYNCFEPFLFGEKIYFNGYAPGSKIGNIYSLDLYGNNFKTEFKDCRTFTAKRK